PLRLSWRFCLIPISVTSPRRMVKSCRRERRQLADLPKAYAQGTEEINQRSQNWPSTDFLGAYLLHRLLTDSGTYRSDLIAMTVYSDLDLRASHDTVCS